MGSALITKGPRTGGICHEIYLTSYLGKMMKEVKLGRVVGPFEEIPFDTYIQSPVGLVTKQNGDLRMVFHLSYDFEDNKSINHYTPRDLCCVKYKDLDDAVRNCLQDGCGCYVAKSDLKLACRNLPVRNEDWKWLVMMARHPVTKKRYFSLRMSPIWPFHFMQPFPEFLMQQNGSTFTELNVEQ